MNKNFSKCRAEKSGKLSESLVKLSLMNRVTGVFMPVIFICNVSVLRVFQVIQSAKEQIKWSLLK